ncbi:MAG: DUF429 domain-containing protein [Proteobacteria bacterium]|nr:DUF429 domain-containing protein [Pseudomonadota bacterium]
MTSKTADDAAGEAAGVDGCAGGWVVCSLRSGIHLYADFAAVLQAFPAATLFVDIPQGLTSREPRRLESLVRRQLPGKASSVFAVPCREAVYADSYDNACEMNAGRFNRRISLQSWNICPKIREVDRLLRQQPDRAPEIYESHPELCFHLLGDGHVTASKKTAAGVSQRLAVLERYLEGAGQLYESALASWRRRELARDDILDAMVLSLLPVLGFSLLADPDQAYDELGLPIRMALPARFQ